MQAWRVIMWKPPIVIKVFTKSRTHKIGLSFFSIILCQYIQAIACLEHFIHLASWCDKGQLCRQCPVHVLLVQIQFTAFVSGAKHIHDSTVGRYSPCFSPRGCCFLGGDLVARGDKYSIGQGSAWMAGHPGRRKLTLGGRKEPSLFFVFRTFTQTVYKVGKGFWSL